MRLARLILLGVAVTATAQSPQVDCGPRLIRDWNRFVEDANSYVHGLERGVRDVRTRARLDGEWHTVTQSECF